MTVCKNWLRIVRTRKIQENLGTVVYLDLPDLVNCNEFFDNYWEKFQQAFQKVCIIEMLKFKESWLPVWSNFNHLELHDLEITEVNMKIFRNPLVQVTTLKLMYLTNTSKENVWTWFRQSWTTVPT